MLYSFDVFDTLITRQTKSPQGIFALVRDRINVSYPELATRLCGDFCALRIRAELSANSLTNSQISESTTIEGIYDYLRIMTALSDEDISSLINLELETEYENIIGISENIEKVKGLLAAGHKVVLISDMYLHEEQIRKLLLKADAVFADIPLYVSSDCKRIKASGNLYRYVRRQNLVRYNEWIHIGDNKTLDVSVPTSLGIDARLYEYLKSSECGPSEVEPGEDGLTKGGLSEDGCGYVPSALQIFNEASRLCIGSREGNTAVKLGATYGAAIIMQYALWTLEMCNSMGIEDVYFVARDGHIVMEAARIINDIKKYDLNLHYIYGAREPWKVTALGDEDSYNVREYIESVLNHGGCSIVELAKALSIAVDEFRSCIPGIEGISDTEKIVWEHQSDGYIFEDINDNEKLKELLITKHSAICKRTDAYLRQELADVDGKVAFVDVFGTGRTQDIIADFIRNKFGIQVVSFYYAMLSGIKSQNEYYSCIGIEPNKATVVEALTRALHGRTVDYTVSDKVSPVLLEDDTDALRAYGYGDYIEAVLDAIRRFSDMHPDLNINEISELGNYYFDYLTDKEYGELLDYIQKEPISNCFYGRDVVTEFAPVITDEMIEENRENGFISIDSSCFYLSLKRCSKEQRRRLDESTEHFIIKNYERELARARDLVSRPHEYTIDKTRLGGRVAIYGAGDVGSSLFRQLNRMDGLQVVAWFDKKFDHKNGVEDLVDNIGAYDFDKLIIAVRDMETVTDIMCDLIDKGIDPGKFYHEDYEIMIL